MTLLRKLVAILNVCVVYPGPMLLVGVSFAHFTAMCLVCFLLALIVAGTSLTTALLLHQKHRLQRPFLLVSGVLWLLLAVAITPASSGSSLPALVAAIIGNINLIFLGLTFRTWRE